MSYLDFADRILAEIQTHVEFVGANGAIDGHRIRRIVWQTDKVVIFEGSDGHFWRYLHAYRQSWPVVRCSVSIANNETQAGRGPSKKTRFVAVTACQETGSQPRCRVLLGEGYAKTFRNSRQIHGASGMAPR